ncbi:hypothetical protein ES288_A06G160300v1 [Gossypium darwinii]|uniref:Uncharacterized protein n=2 Tax=Gossypium darwinii TaxID=34276 RepID=A0A5D2G8I2_GOSDA|nr:hypothetical protein ES288_A06G160300v1 [Gossypium darwinii]
MVRARRAIIAGMANVVRSARMWGGQYASQGVVCGACVGGCWWLRRKANRTLGLAISENDLGHWACVIKYWAIAKFWA